MDHPNVKETVKILPSKPLRELSNPPQLSMRVLLIEDDSAVAEGVIDALEASGHTVTHVATGAEGIAAASDADLVLVDLGLPDMDGTEVVTAVRRSTTVPVIVVSARPDEMDRVIALELGADDFLVKPFGVRELLARMRAVSRRFAAEAGTDQSDTTRRIGRLTIDVRARRVKLDGEDVHLTPIEFDLLNYLAAEPDVVQRRPEILRAVWQTDWFGATKTLDAHIAALRRKLGDKAWIQSVHSVGFRFSEVP